MSLTKLPCEVGGLRRYWIALKTTKSSQNSPRFVTKGGYEKFTVCSYNVLCQSTLHETPHLYTHCFPQYLGWNYRWQLMQKEFSVLDADIFCLQEVEEEYYESHYLQFFHSRGKDFGPLFCVSRYNTPCFRLRRVA